MVDLITEHIDIWTTAQTPKKNGGRGRGKKSNGQSPHGIKKLRELILELAVRGKLVLQDPSDEPASQLLEKIAQEKILLIKEGKIKKQKKLPEIGDDERPFDLPEGWEWSRVRDVGHDWGQKKPDDDFTYIEVSGIDSVAGIVKSPNRLTAAEAPSRARKIVKVGTVIYSTVRPYLQNICVINQEYSPEPIASTAFAILHPLQQMPGKFFTSYLRSPVFVRYVESVQTGIAYPAINDKQFFGALVPVPPLAEQYRIVAKVDELMALCDQLEQQQTDSIATHQTLLKTLLVTLTNVADQGEFAKAWQRIANHFDTLFTTEQSIDQLKQTILQLAVMGKLVPQDPNDEPLQDLLTRIKKSEAVRVQKKEIQKPKKINPDTQPGIQVPGNWAFKTLNEIAFVTKLAGFEYTKHINLDDNGDIPVVRAQNVRPFKPDFTNLKYIDQQTSMDLPRSALDRPALLVTFIGAGIGDVCLFKETRRWHLAPNVAKVEPFADLNHEYINLFLSSPEGREELFKSRKSTAQPSLSMATIREIWVPIPPINEQRRIVAKVDELMAICDALKTKLIKRQEIAVLFVDGSIDNLFGYSKAGQIKSEGKTKVMEIKTILMTSDVKFKDSEAILAPIIEAEGGQVDAKAVWKRSKLPLPDFYKQLKSEIDSGYIFKPAQADFVH